MGTVYCFVAFGRPCPSPSAQGNSERVARASILLGTILAVLAIHSPTQAIDQIRIAVSNPNMPN
jgi:hypothetical protein